MKKLIILLTAVVFSVSTFSQATVDKGSLEYYQNTYDKAKRQLRTGNILTIAGVTFVALGYFISKNASYRSGDINASGTATLGSILFLGGVVMTNVGIPIWISGSIKAKNNEEAILGNFSLQAGLNSNGIGLQLVLKL